MKALHLPLVSALALVVALLVPAGPASSDSGWQIQQLAERGVVLAGDAQSAVPCRLLVEVGADTVVDRGVLTNLESGQFVVGAFRFWNEPAGRMLYVYDDVSNLVGRVVNPQSVILLGVDEQTR